MQGVAGFVVMPHKTTDTRCSVAPATSTDVGVGDKSPASPSKPTTAGKVLLNANGEFFFYLRRHLLNRTLLYLLPLIRGYTEMT